MDGYYISLNSSTLKIGMYLQSLNPKFVTEELLPTVVSHSKIVDAVEFAKEFSRILAKHFGSELPKLPLYFVLEPEVTDLFLITTSKGCADIDEHCLGQVKDRLAGKNLEDLYYSHFKIAPFIYQFVGIRKDTLESFLQVAGVLKLEIGAILPWGLVLAKTNNDVSSMFVFPNDGENTVIFSELTGVTFAEKLEGKISLSELKELFNKLSVYNNKHAEVTTYTFLKNQRLLGTHKTTALDKENSVKDFENLTVAQNVMDKSPGLTGSPINLLNILPAPEPAVKSNTPAIAVTAITVVIAAGLILQLTIGLGNLLGTRSDQNVLAEQDQIVHETPAPTPVEEPKTPQKEVKRTDLKIRVENGNGVAGSAGKLKSYLEGFGYTVASMGNASVSDYKKTTIKLPQELSIYQELLTNDLKTNYSVEVEIVSSKPADYDILVVVGLN